MRLLFTVLFMAAIASLLGCCSRVKEIEIVIPDGYRGMVQIVEDKDSGSEIIRRGGRYFLEIPNSGKISVRSIEPLVDGWFLPVPRYENGSGLSVKSLRDKDAEGLAFWLINYPTSRVRAFFVGSREELDAFDISEMEGFKPIRKELPALNDEEWNRRFGGTID